ncbi:hypothetical protein GEOBRER4_n1000 [Citrifermentans bremense]|nr:hypothetical protein [Citrifermentans bremense]BCO11233.1 hypothetical protein GEOBRER4_n1000 [Citrifermentans bremense]
MNLKPQDIFILLKLVVLDERPWSFSSVATELAMSPSEVHGGIQRAAAARLYDPHRKVPILRSLLEFLIHGVKYAFPAKSGAPTRGVPTGYAAPPLNRLIAQSDDPPPVWPCPEGGVRGYEFTPLYRSVPQAAIIDDALYQLLALVDAVRDGKARERELAVQELTRRLTPQ